jgi:hypothetical protein
MDSACKNTDRELWRGPDEDNGSYYADSIHLTEDGGIGINVGGHVIVKPLREWHALAQSVDNANIGEMVNLIHSVIQATFKQRCGIADSNVNSIAIMDRRAAQEWVNEYVALRDKLANFLTEFKKSAASVNLLCGPRPGGKSIDWLDGQDRGLRQGLHIAETIISELVKDEDV